MLRHLTRPCRLSHRLNGHFQGLWTRSSPGDDSHEPLRILFCGSDKFSIHSLQALTALQSHTHNVIESLHVLCKKPRPTGRGLRHVSELPITDAARELNLPCHQIDTFTGWTPPEHAYNLIVAVSFGLLVPARLLSAARYGGLNLHPSLLPDLRGPAPIHWSLLHRDRYTGVTLQTLHPTRFDQGHVLDQTPAPGLEIPAGATHHVMVDLLGRVGAEMLVRNLSTKRRKKVVTVEKGALRYAPRISPEDRRIDWATWTADEVLLRDRIIGPLWTLFEPHALKAHGSVDSVEPSCASLRLSLHGWEEVADAQYASPGMILVQRDGTMRTCFSTVDGKLLSPTEVTVQGRRRAKNQQVTQSLLARMQ